MNIILNSRCICVLLACVAVSSAGYAPLVAYGGYGYDDHGYDHYAPANYKYEYGVADPHTGDKKDQYESRHGDLVKGGYSLHEADGTVRVVEYTSDPHTGFQAHVKRIGHAVHPQHYGHGGYYGGYGHGAGYPGAYAGYGHGHATSYANIVHNPGHGVYGHGDYGYGGYGAGAYGAGYGYY